MALLASCHCGGTRIELPHPPTSAGECNCTFCARTGAIWGYYQPGELNIVSETAGKVYTANKAAQNEHHFCTTCGMHTYGVSPDWSSLYNRDGTPKFGDANAMPTTRSYAVNLRLIDDFDWSTVTIEKMDGRNNW